MTSPKKVEGKVRQTETLPRTQFSLRTPLRLTMTKLYFLKSIFIYRALNILWFVKRDLLVCVMPTERQGCRKWGIKLFIVFPRGEYFTLKSLQNALRVATFTFFFPIRKKSH